MDDIRIEIKGKIGTFKKMAALANKQEALGDEAGAYATRIALYEEVVDTERLISEKVAEIESGDMTREAQAGATSKFLKEMLPKIGNFGKGIWNAIAHGKVAPEVAESISKKSPWLAEKLFSNMGGKNVISPTGEAIIQHAVPAELSKRALGLARGIPAVGLAGAGAYSLGKKRGRDDLGNDLKDLYPGGGMGGLPPYYPISPGSAGLMRGGPGSAVLPGGGIGYQPMGGYSGTPAMGGIAAPGMGAAGGAELANIGNELSSIASQVASHEARIRNLESRSRT